MSVWDELIEVSKKLDKTAATIQAVGFFYSIPKRADASKEEIEQLIEGYQSWYGDCLSVLPDDLSEKFHLQYEGDGYSITKCITKFFAAPFKYRQSNGHVGHRGLRVYDTEWLYPYDVFFQNPLRIQRQILLEASKRKPTQQFYGKETLVDHITVLFLAANPAHTGKLKLDEEIRAITEKVYASEFRDYLKIESSWATQPDDLLQSLNRYKPHIVHFSGHGSEAGEILLGDSNGRPITVRTQALKELFTTLKDNIQVVILNACYSQAQAAAITSIINCAIGMNAAIGDEAAILFAASFYRALGFGRSVQDAFDQGKVALLLAGIPEESTPELLIKEGIDPSQLILVKQANSTAPLPIPPVGQSSQETKRERLFNAYKVILNAAQEYQAVIPQLGFVIEGETKESRDRRLNVTLQRALADVNDAMIILTLEDVGTDVKAIFDELRQAFNSYVFSLDANAQYANSFTVQDL